MNKLKKKIPVLAQDQGTSNPELIFDRVSLAFFFTPVGTPPNPRFVFDTQSYVLAPAPFR
jgi:hypothetical protein